jgi:mono/diheme cytochrome c family protein
MSSTYAPALFLHSFIRWAVLALFAAVLVRALLARRSPRPWTPTDERVHKALLSAADLQFALGVWLYLVVSPITSAFFAAPRAAMKVTALRFFGIEHVLAMVLAVVVLHVGRIRSTREPDPAHRHRRVYRWTLASFLLVLVGVPWPFMPYGRPLVRTSVPGVHAPADPTTAAACPPVYAARCATCHGGSGRGDGPAAAGLTPRPRDFTDPAWRTGRTDLQLADLIRRGGAAQGLSAAMPAHADLAPAQVDALVRCVRALQEQDQRAPGATAP